MNFLELFKHLLPRSRAWDITITKNLRLFFKSLADGLLTPIKEFLDNVFLDINPATTRELSAWEVQFGLRDIALTEQERRDRLAATWKALGGQDPRYIQDTLQDAGFDVYVHEWWVPGTEAPVNVMVAATARNPFNFLIDAGGFIIYLTECGEALAQCGETQMEAGNTNSPQGYPLVNLPESVSYPIPVDPNTWCYFLYIGGETFPNVAQIDPKRREEFEALCLKICPAHLWLGILVEYV